LNRDGTLDPGEMRLEQDVGNESVRSCENGESAEDLLVFNQLGSRGADPLQNEIEGICFLLGNSIVVDRCSEKLPRARIDANEADPRRPGRQS
jgi:hypothetical protein